MPTQFRSHLLSAHFVPGAILGVGKTKEGEQGKVPALELLLSLGDGHISNTEQWDESHNRTVQRAVETPAAEFCPGKSEKVADRKWRWSQA